MGGKSSNNMRHTNWQMTAMTKSGFTRQRPDATKSLKRSVRKRAGVNENSPHTPSAAKHLEAGEQSPCKPGVCFACGIPGHWRKDCEAAKEASNKISESLCQAFASNESFDSNINSPVGRLKENVDQWVAIGAHEYILNVIRFGYMLPFYELPQSVVLKNNRSSRSNPDIVEREIRKLLDNACVSEVSDVPTVVNPLTVAFNRSGKARLVLDCRHINLCLFKFKFRLEDGSVARHIFNQGHWLFAFDLKSAYHHISIHEGHRQYLGFSWVFEGQTKYFVCNVLPFGVSSAAHIFTKLTRSVITHWRNDNMKIIMYLDVGLAGASSLLEASALSNRVKSDLTKLGFLIAEDKCIWQPTQNITWLGCCWDMFTGTIEVSQARIDRLLSSLDQVITQLCRSQVCVKARMLASIAGQIISMQIAVGAVARLRTRSVFFCLQTRASWEDPVLIDKAALDELVFWKENIAILNGRPLLPDDSDTFDSVVYSDASNIGYGGYILDAPCSEVVGSWSCFEASESSTWRELVAVSRVLNSLSDSLEGQTIKWFTDNKNVKHIMSVGSKKPVLHEIVHISIHMDIISECEQKSINMKTEWVARGKNLQADFLSRCCDSDDWQVAPLVYVKLDKTWGPHIGRL